MGIKWILKCRKVAKMFKKYRPKNKIKKNITKYQYVINAQILYGNQFNR